MCGALLGAVYGVVNVNACHVLVPVLAHAIVTYILYMFILMHQITDCPHSAGRVPHCADGTGRLPLPLAAVHLHLEVGDSGPPPGEDGVVVRGVGSMHAAAGMRPSLCVCAMGVPLARTTGRARRVCLAVGEPHIQGPRFHGPPPRPHDRRLGGHALAAGWHPDRSAPASASTRANA